MSLAGSILKPRTSPLLNVLLDVKENIVVVSSATALISALIDTVGVSLGTSVPLDALWKPTTTGFPATSSERKQE
jgi:hypothetical protein